MTRLEDRSPNDLKVAIWHESLTPEQSRQLSDIYYRINPEAPFEQWEAGFLCDLDVDHEIAIWERIARAVDHVCQRDAFFQSMRRECGQFFAVASVVDTSELSGLATQTFGKNTRRFVAAYTGRDS